MSEQNLVPLERIERAILVLRGHKVMLDSDLATLYAVETKVLNQAISRNIERFPEDFMFQLTEAEAAFLRSQTVTLKTGRGQHRKYLPFAFTEQGVAMLSSVLRSPRAVRVNIDGTAAEGPTVHWFPRRRGPADLPCQTKVPPSLMPADSVH